MRDFFNYLDKKSSQHIKPEELTKVLSIYVTRDSLSDYLSELTNSDDGFENSVPFRYRHQLGFEKYILYEGTGKFERRVRMHVWKATGVESNIHDHAYSFASIIVVGKLRNNIYGRSEDGSPFSRSKYSANGRT